MILTSCSAGRWTTTTWLHCRRICSRSCSDCGRCVCQTTVWSATATCPGWRAGWGASLAWLSTRAASHRHSSRGRTSRTCTTRSSSVQVSAGQSGVMEVVVGRRESGWTCEQSGEVGVKECGGKSKVLLLPLGEREVGNRRFGCVVEWFRDGWVWEKNEDFM